MLFFKEIIYQKLEKNSFKQLYKKECNICALTVKVISKLEENDIFKKKAFNELDIDSFEYEELLNADKCDPALVLKLCEYLNMEHSLSSKNCPRLDDRIETLE